MGLISMSMYGNLNGASPYRLQSIDLAGTDMRSVSIVEIEPNGLSDQEIARGTGFSRDQAQAIHQNLITENFYPHSLLICMHDVITPTGEYR